MTLKDAKIWPTLPAADMDRAKAFYKDKLGVEPADETPGGAEYHLGGDTGFFLFPSKNAGKCPTTYAGWNVDDIEATVKELQSSGVVFEEYDTPAYKTVNGVASMPDGSKAAWFKDSEGNILGLAQGMRSKA